MSATSSAWRVARASTQGDRNRNIGHECQDRCWWAAVPAAGDDALVAAVADGMGSAPESARGARIAVNVAVAQAARALHHERQPQPERLETMLDAAVLAARDRIQQVANRDKMPAADMATTLLLAIHVTGTLAVAQVGDGAAVVSTKDGQYLTFTKPQRGEYVNQTYSITSRKALQQCSIDIATSEHPIRTIALMTDGIVPLTLANADHRPHEPFFAMMEQWLLEHPEQPHPNGALGEILRSEKIRRKTADDTTLLMAVRRCQHKPPQHR